jgi:hypothetical protein
MKTSMTTSLIMIALALVACIAFVVWLRSRPDETVGESVSRTSSGPSFEVRVVVPRMAQGAGALLFFGYYDQTDIFFKQREYLASIHNLWTGRWKGNSTQTYHRLTRRRS